MTSTVVYMTMVGSLTNPENCIARSLPLKKSREHFQWSMRHILWNFVSSILSLTARKIILCLHMRNKACTFTTPERSRWYLLLHGGHTVVILNQENTGVAPLEEVRYLLSQIYIFLEHVIKRGCLWKSVHVKFRHQHLQKIYIF